MMRERKRERGERGREAPVFTVYLLLIYKWRFKNKNDELKRLDFQAKQKRWWVWVWNMTVKLYKWDVYEYKLLILHCPIFIAFDYSKTVLPVGLSKHCFTNPQ
jgi:hypothetical protein